MTTHVLGIPIVRDPTFPRVAEARGLMRKHIVVGIQWERLPMDERTAILYHEAAHCLQRHMEKRVLLVPLLLAGFDYPNRVARAQELEADALAAKHGYGPAMARVLRRFPEMDSIFYPSHAERLERLGQAS